VGPGPDPSVPPCPVPATRRAMAPTPAARKGGKGQEVHDPARALAYILRGSKGPETRSAKLEDDRVDYFRGKVRRAAPSPYHRSCVADVWRCASARSVVAMPGIASSLWYFVVFFLGRFEAR